MALPNEPVNLELFRQRVDNGQSHANIAKGADSANQDCFHNSNALLVRIAVGFNCRYCPDAVLFAG